jgi:2-polyprenyl-3-methyl-5-hydroxy-6-metoxy-1,4-benzoquinol methylase
MMRQSNYLPVNIDMRLVNDPYMMSFASIKPGSKVLEIGCGDASLARLIIAELNCSVWAVEVNPEAAQKAKEVCQEVHVGDFLEVDNLFDNMKFDVILMLDVLEHVSEPQEMLLKAKDMLNEKGYVVCSIPNVAHYSVRLALLEGKFDYNDYGLLDKTHVKFFYKDSIKKLFDDCGYEILSFRSVTKGLDDTEIKVDHKNINPELLSQLANDEDAKTYQYSVVACPKTSILAKEHPFFPMLYVQNMFLGEQKIKQHFENKSRDLLNQVADLELTVNSLKLKISQLENQAEALLAEKDREIIALRESARQLEKIQSNVGYKILRAIYKTYKFIRLRFGKAGKSK